MFTYFRFIHLLLQLISLKAVILFNHFYPQPRDLTLADNSLKRGFNRITIFLTRSIQHFTICSAILLIITILLTILYEETYPIEVGHLSLITHSFQTSVGFLYHFLTFLNPFHLFPRINFQKSNEPEKVIGKLISFVPPIFQVRNRLINIIIWFILHVQHTLAPLHMWIDLWFLHDKSWIFHFQKNQQEHELLLVMSCMIIYGCWNLFCWYVREEPAYPIQKTVWNHGIITTIGFYGFCLFVSLFASYCARNYREYLILNFIVENNNNVENRRLQSG